MDDHDGDLKQLSPIRGAMYYMTKANRNRRGQQTIRAQIMSLRRGKSAWPLLLLAALTLDLVECFSDNVNGNDRGRRNTYSASSRLPRTNYLDANDIVAKNGIDQQEQRSENNIVNGVNGRRQWPQQQRQRQEPRQPIDRNQKLVTLPPHAGYHGGIVSPNDPTKPFFEGWYLRVVLPPKDADKKPTSAKSGKMPLSSFAIIFHVFDPHSNISKRQGVGMQVVTSMGNVIVETPNVSRFQADSHSLDVSNEFYTSSAIKSINERRRRIRQRIRQRQGISKINGDTDDEGGATSDGDGGDFFKLTSNHVAGMASSSSWYSSLSPSSTSFNTRQGNSNNHIVSKYAKTEGSGKGIISSVQFDFDVLPQVGWGGPYDTAERQYSTAGWMAALPVFEPHYQVLISKGVIPSGTITIRTKATKTKTKQLQQFRQEVNGKTAAETNPAMSSQPEETVTVETSTVYDLTNATVYLEKNWGGSFPSKWWWIQANTFVDDGNYKNKEDEEGSGNSVVDLCVTSTGAKRRIPFLEQEEPVALIGLHWNGQFLPFPNVDWDVQWGQWYVRGNYGEYYVELVGRCDRDVVGLPVRCPTDRGMEEIAMETFHGTLNVKLYKKDRKTLLLDATSKEACLELGGIPWRTQPVWEGKSEMTEPIKSIAMNVDLEKSVSDALQVLTRFVEIPGL